MEDLAKTRLDFKIISGENPPIYFDNACMSLRPNAVLLVMEDYYTRLSACAGRSAHKLAEEVTKKVKEARQTTAEFINAKNDKEIIFTRNTTEGVNLLANSFGFKKGDVVLISDKEHNSNLIPWLYLRDKIGIEVKIFHAKNDGSFDLENFENAVKGVKLVSLVHTSNLDGMTIPAKEIISIAHKNNVLVFLDCAQSVAHRKIDVKYLDVDYLAFSGHKVLGPTGTGVFYGKIELLEKLTPFIVGGNTVEYSTYTDYKFLPVPDRFEAGLQDYAGIIGLGEALKYMMGLDYDEIAKHELELNSYITQELLKFPQIKIMGSANAEERSGIINFYIEDKDMHQFALMLSEMAGIAVRSGQHCVHSWFESKKVYNSLRVSLAFYNTKTEAETFIANMNKIMKII